MDDVVDILMQFPVASLRMEGEATLIVRFTRPLKAWEVWNLLAMMAPSDPSNMSPGPVVEAVFYWD